MLSVFSLARHTSITSTHSSKYPLLQTSFGSCINRMGWEVHEHQKHPYLDMIIEIKIHEVFLT